MSRYIYTKCANERCYRAALDGLPYCKGHMREFDHGHAEAPTPLHLDGFEARQWARARHERAAAKRGEMPNGGMLEHWAQKLRKAG